jgi:hypothetical protein
MPRAQRASWCRVQSTHALKLTAHAQGPKSDEVCSTLQCLRVQVHDGTCVLQCW